MAWLLAATLAAGCSGAGEPNYEGRSTESWVRELQAPDSLVRRDAAFALGEILTITPRSRRIAAALVGALGDSSDAVRIAAADALTRNGALPDAAVPGVLGALADSAHAHTRERAANLLGYASPEAAAQLVPRLLAAIAGPARDSSSGVRGAAIGALSRTHLGPESLVHPVRLVLRLAAHDEEYIVRQAALDALAHLKPADLANDLPVFVGALSDARSEVRTSAAFALAEAGEAAAPAIDALIARLGDSNVNVRQAAADALENIGPAATAAVPALRHALADASFEVQSEARKAITRITGSPP